MNELLAEMYGTRETIGAVDGSDVEKLAEAEVLNEVLASEGVDVDDLDGGSILKVAHELFGDDSALIKAAAEEEDDDDDDDEDDDEKTSQAKLAEADFLGRVMAHSFVNEQSELEKEAKGLSSIGTGIKDLASSAHKGVGRLGGRLGKALGGEKHFKELASGASKAQKTKMLKQMRSGRGKMSPAEIQSFMKGKGTDAKGFRRAMREAGVKKVKGRRSLYGYGALGGGAALAGGAGYGGYKAMSKKSSALDELAEQRAYEILSEAQGEEKLASAVEQRAYEMLAEAGYLE